MAERTGMMTIDDFIRRYDAEGPFELVNGEIVNLSPTAAKHTVVTRTIFVALYTFCAAKALGEVYQESPFILTDDSQWVLGSRVPDVMFYEASRWASYTESSPDWGDRPFVLVPDLAVEVVSPTDRYSDIQKKVEGYLVDGVQLVWVVDPARRTVAVYQAGHFDTLAEKDTLSAADILPGFSLPLADLLA